MYLNHFQLDLMPFKIGPDPRFLWLGPNHKKAYAVLHYAILESKGFVVITGEPGTGKSTILNAMISKFERDVRFAKIIDPALNEMDFFNIVASAFGMNRSFQSKTEFMFELESLTKKDDTKKMILVIDEAQRLALEMLEQIRMFSNADTPGRKILSCILAGQPEFLGTLRRNPALSQRIFFSHTIHPLTQSETDEYIVHRLKVAGRRKPIFTPPAIEEIFSFSRGIPRLINIVCDKALLTGYAMDKKRIGPDLVRESTENTMIPMITPEQPAAPDDMIAPVGGAPAIGAPANIVHYSSPQRIGIRPANRFASYFSVIAILFAMGLSLVFYLNGRFRAPRSSGPGDTGRAVTNAQVVESTAGVDELQTLKREIEAVKKENSQLQDQLAEITKQKNAREASLAEAKALNTGLESVQNSARDRVTELEAAATEREKQLNRLDQKSSDLEKALAAEKSAKEQMAAELSSRLAAVADLQQKLETAKSIQLKLETDVRDSHDYSARLQALVQELKSQRSAPVPTAAAPPAVVPGSSEPEPDPARVIDYMIKKKSQ